MGVLLINKMVDKSLLTDGFSIPAKLQLLFYELTGEVLKKGDTKMITLLIGGESYHAQLKNQNFDAKFEGHKDLLQIRYSKNSPLSCKLRQLFIKSYEYIKLKQSLNENRRTHINIPEHIREQFLLYTTSAKDVYVVETILADERIEHLSDFVNEEQFEMYVTQWNDPSASIELKQRLTKVRKVDKSICDNLKQLYDYRCQVTGEKVGNEFGGSVIEAHHIDYFVNSQNNDSSNIIILSPNFHRIIHKFNPTFNHKTLEFCFENGIVEKVRLDLHLKG